MKIRLCFLALGACMMCAADFATHFYSDAIVNEKKYPVMGIDVSHYQGEIDWPELENQGVQFAFIKATEGSSHVDSFSEINLKNAAATDIHHSAYHFFSFDSAGESQAENYISAVKKEDINMPPVVDIEYYGDKLKNPPSMEETKEILQPLLDKLEEYYKSKPIIYTTGLVYRRYIKDEFADYPLWIRNVNSEPFCMDWTFWQYSDKGELYGYNGNEKYIDMNVYKGNMEEFEKQFCGGA